MLKQELQQKQALSPQQILEATLLQLNNSSLEEYILEEFEKNPILEPSEIVIDENESNLKEDIDDDEWDDNYGINEVYESKKEYSFQISTENSLLEKIIDQISDLVLYRWEKADAEEDARLAEEAAARKAQLAELQAAQSADDEDDAARELSRARRAAV